MRPLPLALGVTAVLLALRLHLSGAVGFGDAEALYAAYALHPQPAYLDHPGLVATLARFIGQGGAPSPAGAHRATALLATALPWLGFLAARLSGAPAAGAFRTFFALALLPEIAIGLFALTPDLPLSITWVLALGVGVRAVTGAPGSSSALGAAAAAGLLAGLAVLSKASGGLVVVWLGALFLTQAGRPHLGTAAPWCALGAALVLALPVAAWEHAHGYPMLAHRLVATQGGAGPSLRNLGALVGGQLLYVTPPFLIAAWRVLRSLWQRRPEAIPRALLLASLIPGIPLVALCLWSPVAEPHWVAPLYLALALGAAHVPPGSRALDRICVATGMVACGLGWAAAATPLVAAVSGARYVPRYDLTNDLHAWEQALPAVRAAIDEVRGESGDPFLVGPHWIVCAQLHAALGPGVPVGCRTPAGDDFQGWYPEARWGRARTVLFVTDDRFRGSVARDWPDRDVVGTRRVQVKRGGRTVRTVTVYRLERAGVSSVPLGPNPGSAPSLSHSAAVAGSAVRPAARRSSESPSGPGFGVVRSRSP